MYDRRTLAPIRVRLRIFANPFQSYACNSHIFMPMFNLDLQNHLLALPQAYVNAQSYTLRTELVHEQKSDMGAM